MYEFDAPLLALTWLPAGDWGLEFALDPALELLAELKAEETLSFCVICLIPCTQLPLLFLATAAILFSLSFCLLFSLAMSSLCLSAVIAWWW